MLYNLHFSSSPGYTYSFRTQLKDPHVCEDSLSSRKFVTLYMHFEVTYKDLLIPDSSPSSLVTMRVLMTL